MRPAKGLTIKDQTRQQQSKSLHNILELVTQNKPRSPDDKHVVMPIYNNVPSEMGSNSLLGSKALSKCEVNPTSGFQDIAFTSNKLLKRVEGQRKDVMVEGQLRLDFLERELIAWYSLEKALSKIKLGFLQPVVIASNEQIDTSRAHFCHTQF